jgi:hypothetical protein
MDGRYEVRAASTFNAVTRIARYEPDGADLVRLKLLGV